MRVKILALVLALAACSTSVSKPAITGATTYDPALAQRLGADERGMRRYVLVLLKTGPRSDHSEAERKTIFEGHFSNMGRLAEAGLLKASGPLSPNDRTYRGVFVFAVDTVAEAERLVATDPAVAAGVFAFECYAWYGPAALMEVPDISRRVTPPSAPPAP